MAKRQKLFVQQRRFSVGFDEVLAAVVESQNLSVGCFVVAQVAFEAKEFCGLEKASCA